MSTKVESGLSSPGYMYFSQIYDALSFSQWDISYYRKFKNRTPSSNNNFNPVCCSVLFADVSSLFMFRFILISGPTSEPINMPEAPTTTGRRRHQYIVFFSSLGDFISILHLTCTWSELKHVIGGDIVFCNNRFFSNTLSSRVAGLPGRQSSSV